MADPPSPDVALVERAQGGDRRAHEAIYRRHVRYIAGMAQRLLRDHSDAEDVVQDAFVIAHQQIRSLRDGAALRGWLAQIAVSQVRRKLRRRRLLRVFGLDRATGDAALPELASEAASPEIVADLAIIDGVLLTLPDEQRMAWVIRHVEGAGVEDVAFACGCSLATAKRRIAAADAVVRLHVTLKDGGP